MEVSTTIANTPLQDMALFFKIDLDTVVVMRKAPTQRWGNSVERVMSVLNLGMQGVALARK